MQRVPSLMSLYLYSLISLVTTLEKEKPHPDVT